MELRAAIEALATLKRNAEVHVYTDSLYVRDGITKWIHAWKRNGWRRADKEPVKNADLWQTLDAAVERTPRALALGEGAQRPSGERPGRPACPRGGDAGARRRGGDRPVVLGRWRPVGDEVPAIPLWSKQIIRC